MITLCDIHKAIFIAGIIVIYASIQLRLFIILPYNKPSVSRVILSTALRSVENHVPSY